MNADCLGYTKYKLDWDKGFFLRLGFVTNLVLLKTEARSEKERKTLQKESRAGEQLYNWQYHQFIPHLIGNYKYKKPFHFADGFNKESFKRK